MSNDDFADPSEGRGEDREYFDWKTSKGLLLLIVPTKYETGLTNRFTKPGETKDAVHASIVVLDGEEAGKEYLDEMIWGGVLVGQLKSKIGRKVLGRVAQWDTGKGNPAWTLADSDDADKKVARAYLDKHEFAEADKPPF